MTLFYAEVTDNQKVGPGGGLVEEGELIEVVEFTISQCRDLIFDDTINREPTLLCALYWFFNNIWKDEFENCNNK